MRRSLLAFFFAWSGAAAASDLAPIFEVGGQYDDTSTSLPSEDDFTHWRMTSKRAGHVNLRDNTGTETGTVSNPLYTTATCTVVPDSSTGILKSAEISVATKTESDLSGSSYTVPSGKKFKITTFCGSYDTQSPMYLRLKKQSLGSGSYATLFRITLKQQGQDESNFCITFPLGLNVGVATDVFKITYESALSKGTLWAGFTGIEWTP